MSLPAGADADLDPAEDPGPVALAEAGERQATVPVVRLARTARALGAEDPPASVRAAPAK